MGTRGGRGGQKLRNNEFSADELATVRERERRAVELALSGLDYQQIADQLGYADKSGAWRAIRRVLDRQEATAATEYRLVENARLDRLQTVLWPMAMNGDLKAIDRLLRLFERRAKLNGLDMPVRVEHAHDYSQAPPEERAARLAAMRDELADLRARKVAGDPP